MDTKSARQFLELLGHRGDLAKMERLPHAEKRNHWTYQASHPVVGTVTGADERSAWKKICDLAEKQGPLPDTCEGRTKAGDPCKNTPQRGYRFCGSHLGAAASKETDAPLAGMCQARTSKGRPCQNAPQKGEQYCGPHLTKHRSKS